MENRSAWQKLLMGSSAMALAVAVAPAALAQDEEDAVEVEEMVVTGSRLRTNSNLTSVNPVLTVTDEEIDVRGNVRIEDLVNVLPQVFAGQASEVSNGATGTSTLNLRGLGSIRTLVLIDGRRLPFGSPESSAANLDLVPTQLIERVEIQTGGGSAVYGSDAIGGVANFILKDDFEGIELDVQGGFYQAGNQNSLFENVLAAGNQPIPGPALDGREIFASLILGANSPDGKGNVTLFANYQNLAQITQDNRVSSACSLGPASGSTSFEGLGCVGSANFRLFGGAGGFGFQEEDGTVIPFASSPLTTFNFGPFNFFQRPIERFVVYAKGRYEITEDHELFADLSFVNNSTDAQIAPSASFGFGAYEINCDNPLIQAGAGPDGTGIPLTEIFGCVPGEDGTIPETVSGITASHRNVEGGPRNSNLDNTTWRMVGGLRGSVLEHFDYELFGQFARTLETDIATNDFIVENLQEAFLVEENEEGELVCTSGNPACVPYNIFQRGPNGESLVTQEALDFIEGVGITTGETQQFVFGGHIQANLGDFGIQSPLADSGPGLLIGGEYREDFLVAVPDEISQTPGGGFTGVGGAALPISGELQVAEFFLESQIPLITEAPFIYELSLQGAYRFSDYTTDGNDVQNEFSTDSFYAAVTYAPHPSLRFRGQFQRAVRSPNVIELFSAQDQGLADLSTQANGLFDPCAGPDPLATLEQCANTGVTPGQFGNIIDVISGQTAVITGGNPFLDPEVSDTYTAGLVFTPDFIPGLSVTVDYFNIEVDEAISAGIPVQTILDECLATGDPTFCDLINRDPQGSLNSGTLGVGFEATNINIATLATEGVDFQILYSFDLVDVGLGDLGAVRFDYAATYLDSISTTPFPGAEEIECAGLYAGSCGTPNPQYRHRMLASWDTPWNLSTTLTWRYFGGVDLDGIPADNPIDASLSQVNYLDFQANYQATDWLNFRFGVLNLTGREAPASTNVGAGLGNGNTFPTVYDATGRFFFFGLTFRT